MIRSIAPVRRRFDLDWPEFSRHWREEHARIARDMPGMSAYVQGHARPEDQPLGRPESWAYDGVPFASFADLAAIDQMRRSSGYLTRAVPDEAEFVDRSHMSAVLMVDSFGSRPAGLSSANWRTLLVFARSGRGDEAAGRALVAGLDGYLDEARPLSCRWSVALDADPGLGVPVQAHTAFVGLLEVWFAEGVDATAVAGRIASDSGSLPVDVVCLVVQENEVVRAP